MTQDEHHALQPEEGGTFDFREAPPFALAYLRTYYSQPPTIDEISVCDFLLRDFSERAPRGSFVEIGCGPTVHHALPFAPHVDEVYMADYLEENLEQVRLWRDGARDAHDWTLNTRMTLEREGGDTSDEAIAARENLARSKIIDVFPCDLKKATPTAMRRRFDGVGCFYCVEEIGITLEEWRNVLGRAVDYLKPGGLFYMAALAGMDTYDVIDASGQVVSYPCANIDGGHIGSALRELGFDPSEIRMEATELERPDCGLTRTINVAARR